MTRRVLRRDLLRGGATVAAGAALAACGGQQEGPAVKQSGPVTGPIELMWSNEQSTIDFLNAEWIPSFKRENPQADVTMTIVPGSWDDLYQKIQVTNAAGTPPSLSRGKDYFTGDMAALGIPEPLDKWLKGQKEVTPDQYLPAIWGNILYKGSVIGLPLYSFVRPLYYNVALFREAGLMQGNKPVVADTWQDWARLARQLTQPTKGVWGTQIYGYTGEDATTAWVNYLIQNGGQYINDERTKYTFNSPAGIEALQFIVDLIVKDHACRGPEDNVPDGVRKIAMWNAVGNGAYNNYPKNMPELEYTLTVVPKNKNRGVVARGQGLYMMKNGKNKEGAWAFMRFASRDDNSHKFTVDGIHLGPVKNVNFTKEPYVSDPEWKVNLDQYRVKENLYQPIFGGYTDGAKAIAEELSAAYLGQKTAKDALADAERRATQFLKA